MKGKESSGIANKVGKSVWNAISKYCDSFCGFRQLYIANENYTENLNSI